MIGQTISHYKITEKLGEGGMGEVYLAEDTSLKRKVALKFLPAYLQQDNVAQKRFLREAQSAAALDHPYICHIHEVGEVDGRDFIAMEYVKGTTLQEKLMQGRVPLGETLRIGTEVAEALEEAHEKGIVHRDLKPSNIMLTPKGHAKVMDFGLAKRLPEAGGVRDDITAGLTREGTTLGTLAYMSPEQTRGKVADTRADIFSFGIVLYEMLTGVHPFRRETHADTSSAILNEHPPPLDRYTEDTSDILQHTVKKMLEKSPDERYQAVHEVRTNLNKFLQPTGEVSSVERAAVPRAKRLRWTLALLPLLMLAVWFGWWMFRGELSSVAPGEISSLAVLPLNSLMNDPEQDYFVEGMHEALTLELSKIGALRVISTTSAARYKDSDKLLPEIAKELDVDALVEGSVLRSENQVRITLQLVAFEPERHLWASKYDRELSGILALHSEVAQDVAKEIRVAVTSDDQARLATTREVDPEAYDAYLKGRFYWDKWTLGGLEKSAEWFQKSIAIDPDFAPSWAGLSQSLRIPVLLGIVPGKERLPEAHEAALKAVELDSSSVEARASLGMSGCLRWNWVECEQDFEQALELDPNYALGHHAYSNLYLLHMGRLDEALAEIQRARELEPLSLPHNAVLGEMLYFRGEYDQAVEQLSATIDLDPSFGAAYLFLGDAYRAKGMYEDAVEAQVKAVTLSRNSWFLGYLGSTYAVVGRRDEALRLIEELEQQRTSQYVSPNAIAMIYTSLGEIDRAFEWMDKAIEEQDVNLLWFIANPLSDPLHENPRFEQLLRKLKLPEEAMQKHLAVR